jgi:WD40 repeat protein
LMDSSNGELGPIISHEDFVSAVAWSSDGQLLSTAAAATVGNDFVPVVYLWNAATGQQVNMLQQNMPITSLSFSPDGKALGTLDSTGAIEMWSVAK